MRHVRPGREVPLLADAWMTANRHRFNAFIGYRADGLPGYRTHACFGSGAIDDPEFCLFVRPGNCD